MSVLTKTKHTTVWLDREARQFLEMCRGKMLLEQEGKYKLNMSNVIKHIAKYYLER